jgi:hypothetical protein
MPLAGCWPICVVRSSYGWIIGCRKPASHHADRWCCCSVIGDFIEPVPTIIIFMPLVSTLTGRETSARSHGRGADRHPGVRIDPPPRRLVLLMASKLSAFVFAGVARGMPIYVVFRGRFILRSICRRSYCGCRSMSSRIGRLLQVAEAGYICPKWWCGHAAHRGTRCESTSAAFRTENGGRPRSGRVFTTIWLRWAP